MSEIDIYQTESGAIEVRVQQDTVWLRQEQMSQLFGRERSVITKHLRNVFAEGELDEESNVQNLHIAGSDKPVKPPIASHIRPRARTRAAPPVPGPPGNTSSMYS